MMIYSSSLEEMVVSGFTVQKVIFGNFGYKLLTKLHYTWDDADCVYHSDDIDGVYFSEVPKNGAKTLTLKSRKTARWLVKLDK